MQRLFQLIFLMTALVTVRAGDFSETDRQHLLKELERTKQVLLAEVEGLSPRQARFQPAEDKWAPIHVVEHIVLAEQRLQQLIRAMLEGEPQNEAERGATDREVAEFIVDRGNRFSAPDAVQPKGRYETLQEGIEEFKRVRRESIGLVKSTDRDLRSYRADNPVLGPLDGYQWVMFLSGHAERHTLQIREIKSSPGYPAG